MTTPLRRTLPTTDPDGMALNAAMNAVQHRIDCGRQLLDLYHRRFAGDDRGFKRWCRANLDVSLHSVVRYIAAYQHRQLLTDFGLVSLSDAYRCLGVEVDGIAFGDLDLN